MDWITGVVQAVVPAQARVADPMCGTAAVSEALALAGYRLTAADELTFPVLHARARLLQPARRGTFAKLRGYEGALARLNAVPGRAGYFHREFSSEGAPDNGCRPRWYFTGDNAARIDSVRSEIASWHGEGLVNGPERDLLLHDLILAVNDVANIAGTYGYYRSTWNGQALQPLALKPSRFLVTSTGHAVMQGKVEVLAPKIEADACYLDPPYTKRQYAGNYHVLETIARGDEPAPVGEGGLRDWYDQYSDFCSKRFVTAAFTEVIKRLEVGDIFVSYSEDGILPSEELHDLLADRGSVKRHAYPLQRYRSNNAGKGGAVAEYLYHVRVA